MSLLVEGFYDFLVRLLDESAESGRSESLLVVALPNRRDRGRASAHAVLKLFVLNDLYEVGVPNNFQVSADDSNVTEAERQVNVFAVLY